MIIPIEIAHMVLATFGITTQTTKYERWVKVDGFNADDFEEVLGDSPFILSFDWRGAIDEDLDYVREALSKLNVSIKLNFDEPENNSGVVECNGKRANVRYVPNDSCTSWFDVIKAIQGIMPPGIEFRASVDNGGSDTDVYAVLPVVEWVSLEKEAPEVIRHATPSTRNEERP